MNREIKFRAWDRDNEKMVEDWHEQTGLIEHFGFTGADKFILMQYTEMTDKYDKEIYEGDIIEEDMTEDVYEVVICNGSVYADYIEGNGRTQLFNVHTRCVVTGNIYEKTT